MTTARTAHLIVGTAGHVDHGKTALIKALTGVDTDRLEEEHDRGISIVLGFAEYQPAEVPGLRVGIVDVPGHERFIRTMVAGATGVDAALFVVACDEGVKPQTREHLEILSLLGVRTGVVVLSKSDLAEDAEWVDLVAEEVRVLVRGTFLEGAPVVPVSALTGDGLDGLRIVLEARLAQIPERPPGDRFRLPIDRAFSVKGIGTVVTGSVWSGAASAGSVVEIQPGGVDSRIREIQQHGESVERTVPGTRSALALHGVSVEQARAGRWLVTPGSIAPTRRLDLQIRHLASAPAPLEHNQRVRVHHGTLETYGRLRLLDDEVLAPGQEGFAQIHLEEALAAAVGDRLLIRRYSPMRTIAGATVLDVDPPRHRRREASVLEQLEARAAGDPISAVGMVVKRAGLHGVPISEAARRTSTDEGHLRSAARKNAWLEAGELLIPEAAVERAITEVLLPLIGETHERHPLRRGITQEEAASALGLPTRHPSTGVVLDRAAGSGRIDRDPPWWRLPGFEVRLDGGWGEAAERVRGSGREMGFRPWERTELEKAAGEALVAAGLEAGAAPDLIEALVSAGALVRFPGALFLNSEADAELVERIQRHLLEKGTLSVADFRDLSDGLTRKYGIPILEGLDERGITRREGDLRRAGQG